MTADLLPHVHCGICHREIDIRNEPKHVASVDGIDIKPPAVVMPNVATQFMPVPQPDGNLAIVPVRIYVCDSCMEEAKAKDAAPKIELPGRGMHPVKPL